MIFLYCVPEDMERLRKKVQDAYPGHVVTWRDSRTFQVAEADPMDLIVYCADYAADIKAAYAKHSQVCVLSIAAMGALAMPDEAVLALLPAAQVVVEAVAEVAKAPFVSPYAHLFTHRMTDAQKIAVVRQAKAQERAAAQEAAKVVVELPPAEPKKAHGKKDDGKQGPLKPESGGAA